MKNKKIELTRGQHVKVKQLAHDPKKARRLEAYYLALNGDKRRGRVLDMKGRVIREK